MYVYSSLFLLHIPGPGHRVEPVNDAKNSRARVLRTDSKFQSRGAVLQPA